MSGGLSSVFTRWGDYSTPGPPPVSPYPLYPSLDLNDIPWHVSAGPWGPQVPLVAPTLPTTSRNVTVNSAGAFGTEAAVAGSKITIGTGWSQSTNVQIHASDVEVVIPPGITVGAIEVGGFGIPGPISRVYIHGSTPLTYSGGLMGQLRQSGFTTVTDLCVDGVDMNGAANFGNAAEENQAFRLQSAARVAVLNCRAIAGAYIWLSDQTSQVVFANSNLYHGGATRAAVGQAEGWGFRTGGGPVTMIDCRWQGTRYHNIRPASHGNPGELFYATSCKFMALAEGRTAWLWNNLGNAPLGNGQGAIIQNSDIYTYTAGGCGFGAEISVVNCGYSRVRNNNFFGGGSAVFTQASLNAAAAAGASPAGDHDWSVGNTFTTLGAVPAWAGPGNPMLVPLPGALGAPITGEGACPGYV